MEKYLATKHDQSGTFFYYFLLILSYFKSDVVKPARNMHTPSVEIFDDVIFSPII